MILRRLSLVAAIVIALGGASAFAEASGSFLPRNLAQNSTNLPPQRRPQSGWLQELNLTSQQIQQIKTIRSQSQNQIKPKRQAVQQAQQELHDLLAGKTSTEQVRTKYNQLKTQLAQLETLSLNPMQLLAYGTTGQKPSPEAKKAAQQKARGVLQEAIQGRLLQATNSPKQLQEVMVDFWYNHFNVDAAKGRDRLLVGAYEQQAIRPYALGRFRDLLGATAHHPAMLFYLDNWQNTAPGSPGARGRFQGLNENYARELMELHTLGVDGGYTQQDVIALAKILTGWGIARLNQPNINSNGFYFDPKRHDPNDKVFLKTTIKGSGEAEGEQALDILARSPATARHISYELAQYFVSDRPPTTLVNRLTTINFLEYLRQQRPGAKLLIIWDGASTARRKSKIKSQKSKVLCNGLFRDFKWSAYLRRVVLVTTVHKKFKIT